MQGSNLYVYCGNDPTNRIDISGNNWVDDRLNDIDNVQKAVQRKFWSLGAQKYLREQKNYQTSAWMLEHSLRDNPSDISRGDDSRLAYLIKNDLSFCKELDEILENKVNVDDYYFLISDINISFETGDLFYSIHKSSFTFIGYKQEDGSWLINAKMHDVYDYSVIMTFMNENDGWGVTASLGTVANDAAYISQKTGVINSYEVNVDFWVKR